MCCYVLFELTHPVKAKLTQVWNGKNPQHRAESGARLQKQKEAGQAQGKTARQESTSHCPSSADRRTRHEGQHKVSRIFQRWPGTSSKVAAVVQPSLRGSFGILKIRAERQYRSRRAACYPFLAAVVQRALSSAYPSPKSSAMGLRY